MHPFLQPEGGGLSRPGVLDQDEANPGTHSPRSYNFQHRQDPAYLTLLQTGAVGTLKAEAAMTMPSGAGAKAEEKNWVCQVAWPTFPCP